MRRLSITILVLAVVLVGSLVIHRATTTATQVGTPAASTDFLANKEVVRQFIAAFAAPDPAILDQVLAPDLVNHAAPAGLPPTREGLVQLASAFEAGIPDYQGTIEEQVAEGDLVVTRATASGTLTGEFLGLPPTGRSFAVPAIFIDRVVDGRIVEHWEAFDLLALLTQVGLFPAPGATPGTPTPGTPTP